MNTDFIILCGGQGTRLRSTIGESQKVMASLGHEPFLNLLLKYIQKQGGQRVILATGYKSEDVERYYPDGRFEDLAIVISKEDKPLGTGGAIKKACELVRTANFFVLNGDSFCPADFGKMLDFHKEHKAEASVAVSKVFDAKDYGTITLDDQGHIHAFREKAAAGVAYANAGIYCFKRGFDAHLPKVSSIEKDVFPRLAGESLYGFVIDVPFFDIGTPERYELAKKYLK